MKKLSLLTIALLWAVAPAFANELALGKSAKTSEVVKIPMIGLTKLNGSTTEQLYKMRTDAVEKYRQLLADTYEPNDSIFGACESQKPWWGIWGMQLFREGKQAPEGPAKESVYILNPYRLVSAEARNVGLWDRRLVTKEDMQKPDFPFIWTSGPVSFDPSKRVAQVTYEVSKYNEALAKLKSKMLVKVNDISEFSMIAYNARDLNLPYVYLDSKKSINMRPWPVKAIGITQMLHCGGSCGYPGGCNNMSPHVVELDENKFFKLPARAYLKFWREDPESVGQTADFTFIIDFR